MMRLTPALAFAATLFFAAFSGTVRADTVVFVNKNVLNVDATSMEVKISGSAPQEYPHVGHRSPLTFEDAGKAWAENHFKLTGGSVNQLRINIRNGDVVEKLLPIKKGIKGMFTKDQAFQYDATIDLEIAIVSPDGQVLTSASGKASGFRTAGENATDAEKKQIWSGLVISVFDALDNQLQPQLLTAMGQFVH